MTKAIRAPAPGAWRSLWTALVLNIAGRRRAAFGKTWADAGLAGLARFTERRGPPDEYRTGSLRRLAVNTSKAFGTLHPPVTAQDAEIEGPAGPVRVRHYAPKAGARPGRLVYFHGGGWVIGDLESHDAFCRYASWLAGAAVTAVDYRLAPEHPFPAAAEDAYAAYAWARAETDGPVICGGDSAGGNLALVAAHSALEAGETAPDALWLVYPSCDAGGAFSDADIARGGFGITAEMAEWFRARYAADPEQWADPRVSPLRSPHLDRFPPAYAGVAEHDPLNAQGHELAARLRAAGIACEIDDFAALPHAFIHFIAISGACRAAAARMIAGLDRLFAGVEGGGQGSGGSCGAGGSARRASGRVSRSADRSLSR